MIVKFRKRPGVVDLHHDELIVARMENYADSSFWLVTDVRLAPYVTPHQFSFVGAEDYWSEYAPNSEEERQYAKNKLRNYVEHKGNIWYCTFSGIVVGKPYMPEYDKGFDQGGYFTYSEAFVKLQEIKLEWLEYGDIRTKLPNPNLQPNVSSLKFEYRNSKRGL